MVVRALVQCATLIHAESSIRPVWFG